MKKILVATLFLSISIFSACSGSKKETPKEKPPVISEIKGEVKQVRIFCARKNGSKNIFLKGKDHIILDGEIVNCISKIEVGGKQFVLQVGTNNLEDQRNLCTPLLEGDVVGIKAQQDVSTGKIQYLFSSVTLSEAIEGP